MVGDIAHGRDSLRTRFRLWRHQQRSNRANIQYHYDVSDEFYRLWLDSRFVYSCAYFRNADDTLDDAQAQKLDHICRKLRLAPGERFPTRARGATVVLAAQHTCEATGITLSRTSRARAQEMQGAGAGPGDVRLLDYPICRRRLSTRSQRRHFRTVGVGVPKSFARSPRADARRFVRILVTHNVLGAHASAGSRFRREYVFPAAGCPTSRRRRRQASRVSNVAPRRERALREDSVAWTEPRGYADSRGRSSARRSSVLSRVPGGVGARVRPAWLSLWQLSPGSRLPDAGAPR